MIYRAKLVFALFATKEQLLQVVIFFIARSAMLLLFMTSAKLVVVHVKELVRIFALCSLKKDF